MQIVNPAIQGHDVQPTNFDQDVEGKISINIPTSKDEAVSTS